MYKSNVASGVDIRRLAARVRHSDPKAFKALFELYHQSIFNFIYLKLREVEAAEDVVQETFIKLWENRMRLELDRSLRTYLFTIANNLALNIIRHHKIVLRYQRESAPLPESENGTYLELDRKETHNTLVEAIAKLPESPRTAFMLSRFEHLTYQGIAARLEISVKTVENHIGRALKLLRRALRTAEEAQVRD